MLRVSIYLLLNISEDTKVEEKMVKRKIVFILVRILSFTVLIVIGGKKHYDAHIGLKIWSLTHSPPAEMIQMSSFLLLCY